MQATTDTPTRTNKRLGADEYQIERDRIRAAYGDNSAEAGAMRDKALAELYYRSGWTQAELAKVEGCSQQKIQRRLLFGRFLSFTPNGVNAKNLSEGRFRKEWEATDKSETERVRFQAVAFNLATQMRLGKSTAPKPAVGKAIMDHFADGKWHKLATIVAHVDAPADDISAVLHTMQHKGTYSSHCERKQVGTSHAYRIVRKSGKAVDVDVLRTELAPILDKLKEQGQANVATFSPSAINLCIVHIQKLIEALAK